MRHGTLLGLPVIVHPTWLIVFALVVVSLVTSIALPGAERMPPEESLAVGALVVVLFIASIAGHELAHALAARARGVDGATVRILTPGGLGSDIRTGDARTDLLVAVAGPLISVVLGVTGLALAFVLPADGAGAVGLTHWTLLWLGLANLLLVAFQLVPAVPLDGGRIVCALAFGATGDAARATAITAGIGRAIGTALIGGGLLIALASQQVLVGIWFVLLGWFTLRLARMSIERDRLDRLTAGLTITELIDPDVPTIPAGLSVGTLLGADEGAGGGGGVYRVMDGRDVVGILETRSLRRALRAEDDSRRVGEIAVPIEELSGIGPSTALLAAVERFEAEGADVLLVVDRHDGAGLAGVLRRTTVLERLRTRQAVSPTVADR